MSKVRRVLFVTAAWSLTLLPMPLVGISDSIHCPPIEGLVTTVDAGHHSIVVFVESVTGRTYRVNNPEVLHSHIGHTVTMIAHPNGRDVLIIHGEVRCSDHDRAPARGES